MHHGYTSTIDSDSFLIPPLSIVSFYLSYLMVSSYLSSRPTHPSQPASVPDLIDQAESTALTPSYVPRLGTQAQAPKHQPSAQVQTSPDPAGCRPPPHLLQKKKPRLLTVHFCPEVPAPVSSLFLLLVNSTFCSHLAMNGWSLAWRHGWTDGGGDWFGLDSNGRFVKRARIIFLSLRV